LRESASYVDLGLRLALVVLAGVWGGWALDAKVSTKPLFTILGLMAGFGFGLYWFIMALKDLVRKQDRDDD